MMKLQTPVTLDAAPVSISYNDRIAVLGSCFADEIGGRLTAAGFKVLCNPFGTLYNPVSIGNAVARLGSSVPFGPEDVVEMGGVPRKEGVRLEGTKHDGTGSEGDGRCVGTRRYCSFWHHTSFARETPEVFLENANAALAEASAFWKECNRVIVTLGTAWAFRFDGAVAAPGPGSDVGVADGEGAGSMSGVADGEGAGSMSGVADGEGAETMPGDAAFAASAALAGRFAGETVANCLKRPAAEFTRYRLTVVQTAAILHGLVRRHPGKQFIFTVSPIRHLADGAHGNQLSKSTLLLATEGLPYFPAYEIMMDELRDYRWWAEDMVHPSKQASSHLCDRFIEWALPPCEWDRYEAQMKAWRRSQHRPMVD